MTNDKASAVKMFCALSLPLLACIVRVCQNDLIEFDSMLCVPASVIRCEPFWQGFFVLVNGYSDRTQSIINYAQEGLFLANQRVVSPT